VGTMYTDYIQSLTIVIVFELIEGYFWDMADIHEY
jgi:hypothetical protein